MICAFIKYLCMSEIFVRTSWFLSTGWVHSVIFSVVLLSTPLYPLPSCFVMNTFSVFWFYFLVIGRCRVREMYLPWKCKAELHSYEICMHQEYERRRAIKQQKWDRKEPQLMLRNSLYERLVINCHGVYSQKNKREVCEKMMYFVNKLLRRFICRRDNQYKDLFYFYEEKRSWHLHFMIASKL